MGLLFPILDDHVCLALTSHTTIHASLRPPIDWDRSRREQRTVCGSDAFPLLWDIAGQPDMSITATWPPPIDRRCVDCSRILGLGAGQRHGARAWADVVDKPGWSY